MRQKLTKNICLIIFSILTTSVVAASASYAAPPLLKWSKSLPAVAIRESSPMPIALGGSGARTDIMFGAHDGNLYILNSDTGENTPNWPQQTGRAVNSTPSSALVGPADSLRIYVGSGTADGGQCSGGSVTSFNAAGFNLMSFVAADNIGGSEPQCQTPAIHSSPVIGDTNNNNEADISFGALGLKAWNIKYDGTLNQGWPYYWDDTQFATPALADIDGNGATDIVMAGDSSPGAPVDHRGGIVRALKGNGVQLWEFRVNEIVRSSPVVGDIDGDGQSEVVFGTGNYWVSQAGGATDATKIFVLNAKTGQLKWSRDLGAQTLASPALADFNGDGVRDIAIATWSGSQAGKVWLLKGDNTVMAGYPRDSGGGIVIGQISTGDLNADGRQDVVVPTGGGVFAYNGTNGVQLWGVRQGFASYQNTPLIKDIDGNGKLDIIIAGTKPDNTGVVDRYEFSTTIEATIGSSGWSMFHGDTRLTGNVTPPPIKQSIVIPAGAAGQGYAIATDQGKVFTYGSTPNGGSVLGQLAMPIVGIFTVPGKDGYWLVASDGGIFSFGDAAFYGSTGALRLNKPIVGMAATASGNGYWLTASDGGIFTFGDAPFQGSTGSVQLNKPIVSMMRAPGNGYWLVASDGGIFTFAAPFYGAGSGNGLAVGASAQR